MTRVEDASFLSRNRDLLLLFGLALTIRLAFAALISDTYDYDEFVILLLSRDYAHGSVPYQDFMFFHPPGVLVIFRLLEPATAVWWPLARLFMILVDAFSALLVWQLARRLYGRREAMAAGILYALNPLALVSAPRVGQDPLITALGLLGLLILTSRSSTRSALIAGLCLGLAVWTKYSALLFVPVYIFASPRRALPILLGLAGTLALALVPFYPQLHALYDQTITFQRTRWSMNFFQRLETAGLYWLAVNALALAALFRFRRPAWIKLGFATGIVFLFSAQAYYHYFVPLLPFAALLAAPSAAALWRSRRVALSGAVAAIILAWAGLIDLGGASPLYVTAAHLSDIRPTVKLIEQRTATHSFILADRFEYPYLAHRQALAHYFWNVGVLVNARYLERRLPKARAIVLSYGASSGYPTSLLPYLDRHFRRFQTKSTTVWLR